MPPGKAAPMTQNTEAEPLRAGVPAAVYLHGTFHVPVVCVCAALKAVPAGSANHLSHGNNLKLGEVTKQCVSLI